jgi:hypothetical protein
MVKAGEFGQMPRRTSLILFIFNRIEGDLGQLAQYGNVNMDHIDFGRWMGRREAFTPPPTLKACAAFRDDQKYQQANCTWDEFCTQHLRISRRKVDREIAYLDQFGPAFFTLRQLAKVSVREYAAIAEHVSEDGIHFDSEVIALLPDNSAQLATAVDTLVQRAEDAAPKPAAAPPFDALLKRFHGAAEGLRALEGELDIAELRSIAGAIAEILAAAAYQGIHMKTE